jgi:antitoxin YefM
MKAITVKEARKRLDALIDDVSASHEPVHINGRGRSGVLISATDWRSIQETLHLHSIPGMPDSIIEGLNTPLGQCTKELDW